MDWSHVLSGAVGGMLTFPLKKLWEWYEEKFWIGFKIGLIDGFEKTAWGAQVMAAWRQKKAEKLAAQEAKIRQRFSPEAAEKMIAAMKD